MSDVTRTVPIVPAPVMERSQALFIEQQQRIYQTTDRWFAGFMAFQWLAGIIVALTVSPYTWAGQVSRVHPHVWTAAILGGMISIFPIWLALSQPGARVTRYSIAVAQMLMSSLLIHLTGGRIETHFHVFGSLAFLAFYRDWRVLIPASVVVLVDHFFRGLYLPFSVFGVLSASPWRVLEHGGWVIFENIFLATSCVRSTKEMQVMALHTARLEVANAAIEAREVELHQAKEEAERANQAKSAFLSRMSHELRTPMNAILGFGQVMEVEDLNPLQTKCTGHILKAGRHLLALINEVLDLSRVEAGRLELSLEPVSVGEVLRESLDLVSPLATQQNIHLSSGLPETGHWFVLADRQRLKQVLVNLLSNAIKYNRKEGSVLVACSEISGERLRLEVSDTGCGIAAEDMEKLFVPFERLRAAASEIEGTGLGLTLSRSLMELMSGKLGVKSVPGQGSTFYVELPRIANPLAGIIPLPESEIKVKDVRAYSRVLLSIEDNASNYSLIETILARRPGIQLMGAIQGSVGLDLAFQHHPDLVLLDLHLPDIMGHEVLRRLRESPETRDIPVVIVSADATRQQIERLLAAGADAYLTKPLDVGEFLQVVDKILENAGSRDSGSAPAHSSPALTPPGTDLLLKPVQPAGMSAALARRIRELELAG